MQKSKTSDEESQYENNSQSNRGSSTKVLILKALTIIRKIYVKYSEIN